MIQDVFTGIYNKFNTGNTFDLAVGGRFHPHIAPQNSTYPYSVYFLIVDAPEYTYNTEMESLLIQFDIFDNDFSAVTVLDAQKKLWALFDLTTLTVAGYTHVIMKRQSHRLLREDEPAIWHSITDYEILLYKN